MPAKEKKGLESHEELSQTDLFLISADLAKKNPLKWSNCSGVLTQCSGVLSHPTNSSNSALNSQISKALLGKCPKRNESNQNKAHQRLSHMWQWFRRHTFTINHSSLTLSSLTSLFLPCFFLWAQVFSNLFLRKTDFCDLPSEGWN